MTENERDEGTTKHPAEGETEQLTHKPVLPYSREELEAIGNHGACATNPSMAISQAHMDIMGWLCATYLTCLKADAMIKKFRRGGDKMDLLDFATDDDLAFLVLVLEQHSLTWQTMYEHMEKEKTTKIPKLDKNDKWGKTGLSSPEAQTRFHQLKDYFYDNFYDEGSVAAGNRTKLSKMYHTLTATHTKHQRDREMRRVRCKIFGFDGQQETLARAPFPEEWDGEVVPI